MKRTLTAALNYSPIVLVSIVAIISCSKQSDAVNKITTATAEKTIAPSINDSSLICYLPFNHNLQDSSGHNNNGTVQNGTITYVYDRHGKRRSALSLVNTAAFIEVPEKDIAGLTKGTFSVDFFPTSADGNSQLLMSKMSYSIPEGQPGFYQSLSLGFQTTNNLGFNIRSNGDCDAAAGTGWNPNTCDSTILLNNWNNVVVTFTNNIEKIYLNGQLASVAIKSAASVCFGEPVRLGVWWQQDPAHFNGYMDEFRVYNRVLTVAEVKQLAKK